MSQLEGDEVRREVLQNLSRISDKDPNLRICQLVGNAKPPKGKNDTYYTEDSQLLNWLLEYERRADEAQASAGSAHSS